MANIFCCPRCNKYKKQYGFDICCVTCRQSNGTAHDITCTQIPCQSQTFVQPVARQTFVQPVASLDCCITCNTYNKKYGYDICCKKCGLSNGTAHDNSCGQILCQKSTQAIISSNCCPKCNTYNKFPGVDFCCRTCRDTNGASHGQSCQKIPCQSQTSVQPQTISSGITICNNLRTGQPLYDNNTICFYEANNPYYEFTNFYSAPINMNGIMYPTTEHYFQAQKFSPSYPQIVEEIRRASTPREAFNGARKYSDLVRTDWHYGYKDQVMEYALQAKFTQHPNLKQMLIGTGNKKIVEHTINDSYWGDNGDGTGTNKLGELLMKVRQQINSGILRGGYSDYYHKYKKYKKKYMNLKQ